MKTKTYILLAGVLLISGLFGGLYVIGGGDQTGENDAIVVESVTQKPIKKGTYSSARDLIGQSIRTMPDTKLVTQAGDSFTFESLPSSPVLLSFIFTRCPDQQMCPLVTQKMARVQEQIQEQPNQRIHLVSVTMDPKYDTPKVLKQYAEGRDLWLENWDFVTGSLSTIKAVEDQFHISVLRKDGALKTHNMRTYLIDSNHVVRHVFTGSDWSVKTVMERFSSLPVDPSTNQS